MTVLKQEHSDLFAGLPTEDVISERWGRSAIPLVSVWCITYNHRQYIAIALKGFLLQQTEFPFEILVHDDASTDGTAEVVRAFRDRYPGIVRPILQSENQYSRGVRIYDHIAPLVRGRYVATCEGDDHWTDRSKLQKQCIALDKQSEFVLAYHDYSIADQDGNITVPSVLRGRGRNLTGRELVAGLHPGINIHNSTLMYRWEGGIEPPREVAGTEHGDRVRRTLLGLKGQALFVEGIKPSVYVKHAGGVYSGLNDDHKTANAMSARLGLYRYLLRIRDNESAQAAWEDFIRVAAHKLDFGDIMNIVFRRCAFLAKSAILKLIRCFRNLFAR